LNKLYPYFYLSFLFIISFYQTFGSTIEAPIYDSVGYIQIANNLNVLGIFTDPWSKNYGNFFAPLYPFILSTLSTIDVNLASSIKCFSNEENICSLEGLYSIFIFQAFFGALIYYLIALIIFQITSSRSTVLISLLIIIVSESFSEFFSKILPETLTFFIFTLFLLQWINFFKIKKNSNIGLVVMGLLIGTLSLMRPSYEYLFYSLVIYIFIYHLIKKNSNKIKIKNLFSLIISYNLVLLPWLLRNYNFFETFSITSDYANYILVQRLAYNMMTWKEFFVSFVFWLPDFGDSLSKYLFNENLYNKLTWDYKESYYLLGQTSFKDKTITLAGGPSNHLNYLIFNELLNNLIKHFLVTIPIALRGMWVGGYAVLIPFIFLPLSIQLMKEKKILNIFIISIYPSLIILFFNAFVSVNVVRYNVPIIIFFSLSFSFYLSVKIDSIFNKN
jgi:hypothetical protein